MNFNQPYNLPQFHNFLNSFLPDEFNILNESINPADLSFKPERIKKVRLIGNVPSLDDLHVYEIYHESENDPRVTLSREIFRLMSNFGVRKALAVFTSGNSPNYRFSLATIDLRLEGSHVRQEYSNPRRYSFYLGPNAKVHTPTEFLIKKGRVKDSKDLQERFSVEVVTKEFFGELSSWYFWAMNEVEFPDDEDKDREIRNAKNLIRFITRIIFVWFMKEKELIPKTLFDKNFVDKILNYNDKTDSTYYKAILQNLFFATLNTQMKKDDPKSRLFVGEATKHGYISDGYLQSGYYRYERFIKDISLFILQFENIPFLNGGLFDCLDKRIGKDEIRIDCFSDNPINETRLKVPDKLFFLENEIEVDLQKYFEHDSKKRVSQKARGLLSILNNYNFTIDESTPVDVEIALDPELLGRVFENMLANYNPETAVTARKATGSYYTPREIVEYMVDESLIAYLKTALSNNSKEFEDKLRSLFNYSIEENPFDEITEKIIEIIENIKILDPACGSGAFPMGILHKLVLALHKLDKDNIYWKKRLLEKVPTEIREETSVSLENKSLDYIHKLGLIEHCIYGVDIQEIAVQISKLRFFISLLIDQQPDDNKPNRDINSLPNLETKFVVANTLIGLEKLPDEFFGSEVSKIIKELFKVREDFFYTNSRWKKKELERKEEKLKETLIAAMQKTLQQVNKEKVDRLQLEIDRLNKELDELSRQPDETKTIENSDLFGKKEVKIINNTQGKRQEIIRKIPNCQKELNALENPHKEPSMEIAKKIVDFNPYDQNKSNGWFDPKWMFGVKDGFDIVIANPPYIQIQNFSGMQEQKDWERQKFETYVKTGDVYCLFYERGYKLLRNGGVLTFITSNKWMRANYGKVMRKFFSANGSILQLIDFGDSPIFENATTYTNILIWEKDQQKTKTKAWDLSKAYASNTTLDELLKQQGECEPLFNDDSFVVVKSEQTAIKKRIEEIGVLLKDWDISINYGIKTGLNEAFIIDGKKKDELIAKDPKSAEIIKPILLGKDIKRYRIEYEDLWLINSHNGYTDKSGNEILRINVKKDYPAIWEYFNEINKELDGKAEVRYDQGAHWTNLRNCDYVGEFDKPKIAWGNLALSSQFSFVEAGFFVNAPSPLITPGNKYLLAVLNSKVGDYYIRSLGVTRSGGYFEYKPMFVENLPVPKISAENQLPFEILVDCILFCKSHNNMESESILLETIIDGLVYDLYFPEEMKQSHCYITDRISEVIKPFKEDDSFAFKTEYIKTLEKFFNKDETISHSLVHRHLIKPVQIILGGKK